MILSIVRCDDFGVLNYFKLYKRVGTIFFQVILQKNPETPEFVKVVNLISFYKLKQKQIFHVLKTSSFSGSGSIPYSSGLLLTLYARLQKKIKLLACLPVNGQRTRSNSKTSKKIINIFSKNTLNYIKKKRVFFGKLEYSNSLKKLIKKPTLKNKNKIKNKGPVKRSKDKKKSV